MRVKLLITVAVVVATAMLSGCANDTILAAHKKYVETMGPPLIKYSKKDKDLDPQVLEARIKLQEAAETLIKEYDNK